MRDVTNLIVVLILLYVIQIICTINLYKRLEEVLENKTIIIDNSYEKYLLNIMLQSEVNVCSDETAYLALATVFNRARIYSKTIEQVLLEPNQYVLKLKPYSGRFTNVINVTYNSGVIDSTIMYFCNKEVQHKLKGKVKYESCKLVFK